MKKSKLLLALALPILTIPALVGCGSGGGETLVAWTFSSELKEIAEDYYREATGKKVKVVIKSTVTQVQSDLDNALRSGKNIPDIVALEAAVIADFTSKTAADSKLVSLDDIEGTDDMYQYTKGVATSTDGKLLGLSWQATPGGFFYKKSIATKLGINSVEEMENAIGSWENYLALAKRAHEYDLDENKDGEIIRNCIVKNEYLDNNMMRRVVEITQGEYSITLEVNGQNIEVLVGETKLLLRLFEFFPIKANIDWVWNGISRISFTNPSSNYSSVK
ncbi:extracellular solute-binding protein [uncultured Fibrobacter sp.]|uniref:extracellular solute-binding protein n=1 Tax=uncultured Fibrobacter sp. TaxID=261512 RepID=UPI00261F5DFC|nr:extracellular solute-binding protein [uncultured Fibrobacter sp.]